MSGRRRRPETREETIARLAPRAEDRAEPACGHAAYCGGCAWQMIAYRRQLEIKRAFVADCYRGAGLAVEVPEVTPSPDLYAYRNRMEFSFSAKRWLTPEEIGSGETFDRSFALGLHPPGTFQRVLDIHRCELIDDVANRTLDAVRRIARATGMAAWDPFTHEGFFRFLGLRIAVATGERLVTLVTREAKDDLVNAIAAEIKRAVPEITTIVQGITDRVADTTEGAVYRVLDGPGVIIERLGALEFEISANSFFQPNSRAAAIVFGEAVRQAQAPKDAFTLDLFCGTGTLGLFFAAAGARVVGYELNPDSVQCARRNAARNGIGTAAFETLDLAKGIPFAHERPAVLVTDPPRAGMSDKLIDQIIGWRPRRIVSVGCNAKTQAPNLARFVHAGWRIEAVRPIDQFPHTPHVEVVTTLALDE